MHQPDEDDEQEQQRPQLGVQEEEKEEEEEFHDANDPNVAAMRASNLLLSVLKQCSQRLGFASLHPQPMLDVSGNSTLKNTNNKHDRGVPNGGGGGGKTALSLPSLFSLWASEQCSAFLQLFALERRASQARHELMRLGMKVRFREKALDNKLLEKQLLVHEREVRKSQRDQYRAVAGGIVICRSRCIYLRSKLREKSMSSTAAAGGGAAVRDPLRQLSLKIADVEAEIARLKKQMETASRTEFRLEVGLVRLELVNREELRKFSEQQHERRQHQQPRQLQPSADAASAVADNLDDGNHNNKNSRQRSLFISKSPKRGGKRVVSSSPAPPKKDHSSAASPLTDSRRKSETAVASTELQVVLDPRQNGRALVGPSRFPGSPQIDATVSGGAGGGTMLDFPVRVHWMKHDHMKRAVPRSSALLPPAGAASGVASPSRLGLRTEYSTVLKGTAESVWIESPKR